jgi:hypothetical protein
VDSTTVLDDVERRKILHLPALELRPLRRPARSQSLYRLRYELESSSTKEMQTRKNGAHKRTQRHSLERRPRWLTAVAVRVSRGCSREAAAVGVDGGARPGLMPLAATARLSRSPPEPGSLLWNSARQADYATRTTPSTGSITSSALRNPDRVYGIGKLLSI